MTQNNLNVQTFQLLTPNISNTMEQMFRLRHKGFIVEQAYEVNDYNGIDFDQYDNPFAHYLTISKNNTVLACARFNRTDFRHKVCSTQESGNKNCVSVSFMAQDQWSDKIPQSLIKDLPKNTWELTRFYVDSSLEIKERAKLSRILFATTYIISNQIGIENLIFVTHKAVISGIVKCGIEVQVQHEVQIPDFYNVFLANCPIEENRIAYITESVFNATGINVAELTATKQQSQQIAA